MTTPNVIDGSQRLTIVFDVCHDWPSARLSMIHSRLRRHCHVFTVVESRSLSDLCIGRHTIQEVSKRMLLPLMSMCYVPMADARPGHVHDWCDNAASCSKTKGQPNSSTLDLVNEAE